MPRSIKNILDQCDDYLNGDETDIDERPDEDLPQHEYAMRKRVRLLEDTLVSILGLQRIEVMMALENPDPPYVLSQLLGLDRFGKGHDIDLMLGGDNVIPIRRS